MKRLDDYRVGTMFVAVLASILCVSGKAEADFTFGEPTALDAPINSGKNTPLECMSADGLELYMSTTPSGGSGGMSWDLIVSTRPTANDPWSVPVNLGPPVNTDGYEAYACLSNDGLELYFTSRRSGGYGRQDIWVTTRESKGAEWGEPVNLGPAINTSGFDMSPWITPDGLELYFASDRPGALGGDDIWVSRRTSRDDPWQTPVNLGQVVNSTGIDFYPCLSPDGLVLFFSDFDSVSGPYRPGGFGKSDMWMTRRRSTTAPWEPPVNLGHSMNTEADDAGPELSFDGSVLYFSSTRSGGPGNEYNTWQAPIIPLVDFNGDGVVDAADMCIMVDHWGENYSLCDIGPMPWGDGVVDVEDIEVLADHLFEVVVDPSLIVHWPLDETQGVIAYDDAGTYDGTLVGGPAWQPDVGIVGGALLLDGVDDYVETDPVLNPADPEMSSGFSVVAWIQAGAPGQVVISGAMGSNWLMLDAEGKLMTELESPGRSSTGPLLSDAIIIDGHWHRIGLVWDGSHRRLYVDGAEVARDTESFSALEGADRTLYIGAGKAMEPGTFWAGLIDDVRIYNRAVTP